MARETNKTENYVRVSYRFPPDMLAKLEDYATSQERNITDQIIFFIKQGLADAEKADNG